MKKQWIYLFLLAISFPSFAQNVNLLNTYPSDKEVFIQGLELNEKGKLLYSSGLYGKSEIGYLSLTSAKREVVEKLPSDYFGEGMTITPYGVWQLSWQEQTAFLRDVQSLQIQRTAHYLGEGWGLAYDKTDDVLWLSSGSDRLQKFEPKTFDKKGEINVHYLGQPVSQLNELEFANGFIYANIWHTNYVVKISPKTGEVVKIYDFTTLVQTLKLTDPDDVLNGIAHIENNRFYVTGKRFPVIWEVELEE